MDYANSMRSLGIGIGFSLMLAVMNGLSTYLFKGDTVSEVAVSKFGGGQQMVSILPTSGSANGIVSWLWYGMLATAAFAITQGVVGSELTEAIRKKA